GINDANYIVPSLAVLFVGSELIKNIRIPYITLVEAAGKYKENKNLNIYEAILNLILSILFVKFLGVYAVLLASLVSGAIRTTLYIIFTYKNIIECSIKKVIFRLLVNIMVSVIIIFIPFSSEGISLVGWFQLALKVSFSTIIILLSVNILFDTKSSKELLNRIKGLLKIKKLSRYKI
ncbi:hypothetical protein V7114_27110, partial [Neobacillus niacini]